MPDQSPGPELPALALAVGAGLGASTLSLGPTPALLSAGISAAVAVALVLRHRRRTLVVAPPPLPAELTPKPRETTTVTPAMAPHHSDRLDGVYQAVLDHLPHGVAALDPKGAMWVYNPAAKQILGTMTDVPIGRALAGHIVDAEDVLVMHPKTGSPTWLRVTARPLEVDDRSGSVVVFEDITTRKEVELALSRSELRHGALLEGAPYGVAIIDAAHALVEHNPALDRLLGHPDDMLTTLGQLEVGDDNVPLLELLGPDPAQAATRIERSDGTVVEAEVSVAPIASLGEAPWLYGVTLHDITDRVRAERMKDAFISTVSHELRTPLTSIMGSLKLLQGGAVGTLEPNAQRMVQIAESNSQRLLALVDDLLDLQRLASGRLEFELKPVNLVSVLAQAADANRGYVDQLGVHLEPVLPPHPVWVWGDERRLLQVFANLISNAAKYSPEGQDVTLTLGAEPTQVHVQDRGPGIPEAMQARVFERFANGEQPANPHAMRGTGLGLAISLAIAEGHGGTLDFETADGQGTTFTLTLPSLATTPQRPGGAPGSQSQP